MSGYRPVASRRQADADERANRDVGGRAGSPARLAASTTTSPGSPTALAGRHRRDLWLIVSATRRAPTTRRPPSPRRPRPGGLWPTSGLASAPRDLRRVVEAPREADHPALTKCRCRRSAGPTGPSRGRVAALAVGLWAIFRLTDVRTRAGPSRRPRDRSLLPRLDDADAGSSARVTPTHRAALQHAVVRRRGPPPGPVRADSGSTTACRARQAARRTDGHPAAATIAPGARGWSRSEAEHAGDQTVSAARRRWPRYARCARASGTGPAGERSGGPRRARWRRAPAAVVTVAHASAACSRPSGCRTARRRP